jgi:double zinc ribbon protein
MPAPAIFGIHNDGLNLAVNLLVLFLVVVWVALIAWTYLDARRRISDSVLVACATGASLFPFVGTIVYTILRPPEFLEDAKERELEIRASELRLRQLEEQSCPNCEHPIERTFLRCPNCRTRVKDPCESCGKPIDPRWTLCPYCETPVRRSAPAEPERRTRVPRAGSRQAAEARKPERPTRSASAKDGSDRPATRSPRPTRRTASSSSRSSASESREPSSRPSRRSEPGESSSPRSK